MKKAGSPPSGPPVDGAQELRLATPVGELVGWALGPIAVSADCHASATPCFVCFHGDTDRASGEWAIAGEVLAAAGFPVVLMDSPGYGASAALKRLPTKSELYAADGGAADVVWAAACAAAAATGVGRVVLCGASMGGGHVLSAVVKHGCETTCADGANVRLCGLVLWYPSFKEQAGSPLARLAKLSKAGSVPVLQAWAKDDVMHPPAKTIDTTKWGSGASALEKGLGAETHVFSKKTAFRSGRECEAVAATAAFARRCFDRASDAGMSKQQNVLAAFKACDSNGDGTISEDELKSALLALPVGLSEEEVAVLFQKADANKDGVVDYEEFIAWLYADPHEAITNWVSGV